MTNILLVEDSAGEAALIKQALESENYLVDHVGSSEQALVLVESKNYDLLILDWELPGISGGSMCKKYRDAGGTATVLFLTGRSDMGTRLTGLEYGGDDYLVKPFNAGELAARVRALLRRPKTLLGDVLKVPGLTLNPSTRIATVAQARVSLSGKECAVLEYLMRHANHSFSSRELLNAVWSSQEGCTEDTVRACIRLLRKKLTVDGSSVVKTSRWSGYMVEDRTREGEVQSESPC